MVNRRIYTSSPDAVFFEEREFRAEKPFQGIDTVGPLWVVGIVEVIEGSFAVIRDGKETWFERGFFGMFKTPFCLTETKSEGIYCRQHVAFFEADTLPRTSNSFAFASEDLALPGTIPQLIELPQGKEQICSLDRCSKPSALARKAKRLLDEGFAFDLSIKAVATQLKTSNAVLTAAFKRDFGLTPHQYRARIRTTLSVARLLAPGAKVIDVAQDVGYKDLSRFNKQFKAATGVKPKDFRGRRIGCKD